MVSPSVKALMACNPEHLIGAQIEEYYVDEQGREKLLQALTDGNGVVSNYEAQIRRLDGKIIWVSTNAHFLTDDQGNIAGIEGTIRNITRLKQTETELQDMRQRHKQAQRIAHLGHWQLNLVNDELIWSEEVFRIFEIDPGQFGASYEAFLEAVHPDDRQLVDNAYSESLANRTGYELEHRLQMSDGRIKWVEERCETSYTENGEPLLSVGTVLDITDRKIVEQKLLKSETRFRDLFEKSPDPCWIIDENNLFVLCNQAAADILGYQSIAELAATHPSKLSPPTQPDGSDSFEKANAMMAAAHDQGVHRFEWEHKRKNGECFPVEVTLARIEIAGKQQLYCTWHDIIERKQAEKALRREADFRTQLFEQASEGFVLWRPSTTKDLAEFIFWNRRMREITGYSMQEINQLGWLQTIYASQSERDKARKTMQMVLNGKPNPGADFEIVTKSGDNRTVHISSSLVQSAGFETCVLAVILDVTESRRQQQLLEAGREKFSTLFESSTDGLFILDMQGRIIDVNKTAHERLGYSKQALMRMNLTELDPPEFAVKVPEHIARVREHGMATFETAHYRKDGSIMPVEVNARILELDGEQVLFSVIRDISERKEFEERLRQSQKMEAIGTLVGGIAHDFNNMLAAMQGNVYLAKMQMKEHPKALDKLTAIEQLGHRAADIVRQLLTFARKDTVSISPLNLNAFMREAYQLTSSVIPENIDHQTHICAQTLHVEADATQLQQALMNLLNNAVDAVKDQPMPQIRCSLSPFDADQEFGHRHPDVQCKHFACIAVQDNGHGISDENLERIFDPFFTTKEVGKGTGLGLAMLYGAVQTHQGTIEVDSEPESGTEFRVYLPLHPDQPTYSESASKPALSGDGECILLVDDECDIRETTREVLEALNYRVIEADDGVNALQQFEQHSNEIDMIITDIVMPGLGGLELLSRIRKADTAMPVLLVTGYNQDQVVDDELQDEHCRLLAKPFDFDQLNEIIQSMINPQ